MGIAFDGSKTYKLHLPPNIPAKNFWSLVLYDYQALEWKAYRKLSQAYQLMRRERLSTAQRPSSFEQSIEFPTGLVPIFAMLLARNERAVSYNA